MSHNLACTDICPVKDAVNYGIDMLTWFATVGCQVESGVMLRTVAHDTSQADSYFSSWIVNTHIEVVVRGGTIAVVLLQYQSRVGVGAVVYVEGVAASDIECHNQKAQYTFSCSVDGVTVGTDGHPIVVTGAILTSCASFIKYSHTKSGTRAGGLVRGVVQKEVGRLTFTLSHYPTAKYYSNCYENKLLHGNKVLRVSTI